MIKTYPNAVTSVPRGPVLKGPNVSVVLSSLRRTVRNHKMWLASQTLQYESLKFPFSYMWHMNTYDNYTTVYQAYQGSPFGSGDIQVRGLQLTLLATLELLVSFLLLGHHRMEGRKGLDRQQCGSNAFASHPIRYFQMSRNLWGPVSISSHFWIWHICQACTSTLSLRKDHALEAFHQHRRRQSSHL